MASITINIPGEGKLNAKLGSLIPTSHVIAEDFSIRSFEEGVVAERSKPCDPTHLHLRKGTPIMFKNGDDTFYGHVLLSDAKEAVVVSRGTVQKLPVDRIFYRMNMTIDDLTLKTEFKLITATSGSVYMVPKDSYEDEVKIFPAVEANIEEQDEQAVDTEEEEELVDDYLQLCNPNPFHFAYGYTHKSVQYKILRDKVFLFFDKPCFAMILCNHPLDPVIYVEAVQESELLLKKARKAISSRKGAIQRGRKSSAHTKVLATL